ncbi:DUF4168 domain-containing protein [Sinorhizobium terangae]|uniref:DUF4168 domain-containing protein n=1 Tax=Sinorhizobium terangae TaxID=110322 RepID=A0A6N7L9Q0_SINTE|nr:DUF4168 domain-containing protein [Sinorhizobium terangae]MQX14452.1 DUF4168 domain-containing protein [Sinorhizobium terangae]WFU49671.1 DUF4168 domain-containing protein [Sinorhizobium terangae]
MITRYKAVAMLTAAVFGMMTYSPAFALEMAQAQQTQPTPGQPDSGGAAVSDQKIEAFAVAYLQVDKVRQEYSAKIEATPDQAAKEKLKNEASQQMVQAVEASQGISVEEYTSILTAAQNDPALAKKVQEKIQSSAPAQAPAQQAPAQQ